MDSRIECTIANLNTNRFDAYYVKDKDEAFKLATSFLKDGEKVARGGSLTLKQIGLVEYIESPKFDYFDSYSAKTSADQKKALEYRFLCDTFFSSTNAVTENGELYNVDGRSNRVAPLVCGPEQVVVVVGKNKLVKNLDEARKRIKTLVAPTNCKTLKYETPCTVDGVCHDCKHPQRACCTEVIIKFNRIPNRIKVIIVDEDLGV